MKYDYLVFIGRFQPFHNGHKHVIKEGLKIAKKIIVFCGSANQPKSAKNPWSYKERRYFILKSFDETTLRRLCVKPSNDYPNDKTWVEEVEKKVGKIVKKGTTNASIALIGCDKDQSSYYLKLFTKWKLIEIQHFKKINATHIRDIYCAIKDNEQVISAIKNLVPKEVLMFLIRPKVRDRIKMVR
ncbi:adenylyltransferase/cytidyltransferase family protein [Candidatus Bandiella euplotis]|uniref:Nicotinamide-nucleotide adenylyltransferase n=1 Tax=Candidatus Bandiella euplotis TaxID=1664265 RepID=A0ABZ0UQY8_9RICK|nr:adenylyltransferase/cytidyltransferase family protein [Candidatus Bandiella woodruffii]WPX96440.1 Nicotinamide-nucleotide adenylyltransferase [Candidatus Bandiella woodruffii]